MNYLAEFRKLNPQFDQYDDLTIYEALPTLDPNRFGGLSLNEVAQVANMTNDEYDRYQYEQGGESTGALSMGFNQLGQNLQSTGSVLMGDNAGVVQNAKDLKEDRPSYEQYKFGQDLAARQAESDDSLWDGITNVAIAAWNNPQGAWDTTVSQLPNMAAPLAGGLAGAKVGAALGPWGAAGGFFAGMFAGNAAIEIGASANEKAADGTFTDEESSDALNEGMIKGGVVALVDTATVGTNRFLAGAPGRAVAQAAVDKLTELGVDVAKKEAIDAAMQSPEIVKEVLKATAVAHRQATTTGKRVGTATTGFGLETASEGTGEYLGSLAATGEASFTDAALESMLGVPVSAVELGISMRGTNNEVGLLAQATRQKESVVAQQLKAMDAEIQQAMLDARSRGGDKLSEQAAAASVESTQTAERIRLEQEAAAAKAAQQQAAEEASKARMDDRTIPYSQESQILADLDKPAYERNPANITYETLPDGSTQAVNQRANRDREAPAEGTPAWHVWQSESIYREDPTDANYQEAVRWRSIAAIEKRLVEAIEANAPAEQIARLGKQLERLTKDKEATLAPPVQRVLDQKNYDPKFGNGDYDPNAAWVNATEYADQDTTVLDGTATETGTASTPNTPVVAPRQQGAANTQWGGQYDVKTDAPTGVNNPPSATKALPENEAQNMGYDPRPDDRETNQAERDYAERMRKWSGRVYKMEADIDAILNEDRLLEYDGSIKLGYNEAMEARELAKLHRELTKGADQLKLPKPVIPTDAYERLMQIRRQAMMIAVKNRTDEQKAAIEVTTAIRNGEIELASIEDVRAAYRRTAELLAKNNLPKPKPKGPTIDQAEAPDRPDIRGLARDRNEANGVITVGQDGETTKPEGRSRSTGIATVEEAEADTPTELDKDKAEREARIAAMSPSEQQAQRELEARMERAKQAREANGGDWKSSSDQGSIPDLEGVTQIVKDIFKAKKLTSDMLDSAAKFMGVAKKKKGEKQADRIARLKGNLAGLNVIKANIEDIYNGTLTDKQMKEMADKAGILVSKSISKGRKKSVILKHLDRISFKMDSAKDQVALKEQIKSLKEAGKPIPMLTMDAWANGKDGQYVWTEGDYEVAKMLGEDVLYPPEQRTNVEPYKLQEEFSEDPMAFIEERAEGRKDAINVFIKEVLVAKDQEWSTSQAKLKPAFDAMDLGIPTSNANVQDLVEEIQFTEGYKSLEGKLNDYRKDFIQNLSPEESLWRSHLPKYFKFLTESAVENPDGTYTITFKPEFKRPYWIQQIESDLTRTDANKFLRAVLDENGISLDEAFETVNNANDPILAKLAQDPTYNLGKVDNLLGAPSQGAIEGDLEPFEERFPTANPNFSAYNNPNPNIRIDADGSVAPEYVDMEVRQFDPDNKFKPLYNNKNGVAIDDLVTQSIADADPDLAAKIREFGGNPEAYQYAGDNRDTLFISPAETFNATKNLDKEPLVSPEPTQTSENTWEIPADPRVVQLIKDQGYEGYPENPVVKITKTDKEYLIESNYTHIYDQKPRGLWVDYMGQLGVNNEADLDPRTFRLDKQPLNKNDAWGKAVKWAKGMHLAITSDMLFVDDVVNRAIDNRAEQGFDNGNKTILSLFDYTGEWSQPWADAGYNVVSLDIQNGHDIRDIDNEYLSEVLGIEGDVYGILAACPCTDFANAGNRWKARKKEDGSLEASKQLVIDTLQLIEFIDPPMWALENPIGEIKGMTGLPRAGLQFQPYVYGSPYTKETQIFGKFVPYLPTSPVEPAMASVMHERYGGKSLKTKNARSETPRGFAAAFFEANNDSYLSFDNWIWRNAPQLNGAAQTAVANGVTEEEIREYVSSEGPDASPYEVLDMIESKAEDERLNRQAANSQAKSDRAKEAYYAPIDEVNDNLLDMISKYGGLDKAALIDEGVDPEAAKTLRSGIRYIFTQTDKSKGLDEMAELLQPHNILTSENKFDRRAELLDKVMRSVNQGEQFYTEEGEIARLERLAEQDYNDYMENEAVVDEFANLFEYNEGDLPDTTWDDIEAIYAGVAEDRFTKEDAARAIRQAEQTSDAQADRQSFERDRAAEGQSPVGGRVSREDSGADGAFAESQSQGQEEWLTSYSEEDISEEVAATRAALEAELAKDAEAERKAQADKDRDNFGLTGSDLPADQNPDQDTLFSLSSGTVDKAASNFNVTEIGVKVNVVDTYADIPQYVKDGTGFKNGDGYVVEGMMHKGQIYLVRENIRSQAHAEEIIFHETTHAGLNAMLADDSISVSVQGLWNAIGGINGLNKLAADLGLTERLEPYMEGTKTISEGKRKTILVHELLAFEGQITNPTILKRLQQVIGAIRNWLRKNGFATLAKYSAADIAYLAKSAREFASNGKGVVTDNNTLYSLASRVEQFKATSPVYASAVDRFNAFRFVMQDKLIDLRNAQDGLELEDDANPYQKASIWEGRAGEELNDFDEQTVEPLLQSIADTGLKWDEVGEWLVSRHTEEANAYLYEINYSEADKQAEIEAALTGIQEINGQLEFMRAEGKRNTKAYRKLENKRDRLRSSIPAIEKKKAMPEEQALRLSGRTNAEARAFLEKHKDNAKLQEVGVLWDQMNNARIDLLVDAGLISEQDAKNWRGRYKHYAPLKREEANELNLLPSRGQGFQLKGKESKQRVGNAYWNPANIVANAITQYEVSVVRKHKNEVAQALLKFVEQNPNEDLYFVERERTQKVVRNGKVVESGRPFESPNEMVVKEANGKEAVIVFNPADHRSARMVKGLKNLAASEMNTAFKAMAYVTRFLSNINTSYNPEFIISNFARDLQTAAYNLSNTELKNAEMATLKQFPKAMAGMRSFMRGDKSHEWADIYDDFRKHGGKTGWIDLHKDVLDREKDLQKMADRLAQGKSSKTWLQKLGKFVEDYNAIVENAVRLSAYKSALDAGLSKDKAAALAKDLTVNFNRKGNAGQMINALYMFYNASIQGSVRLLQAMKSPKGRKLVASTIAVAVALDIANRAIAGDDEDGENLYDALPDYVKNHNLIIWGSSDRKEPLIKIPLPWGYNVFHTFGQQIGKAMTGKSFNMGDAALTTLSSVMEAFNPVGSATVLQTAAPTFLDPIVMQAENLTFAGIPLKPSHTFDVGAPKPEYQMHWSTARETSQAIAKWLNDATDGDAVRPGWINISPEEIDLYYDYLTGGAGRTAANIGEVVGSLVRGEPMETENTPFLRKVTGFNPEKGVKMRYYDARADMAYTKKQLENLTGSELLNARKQPEAKLVKRYEATEKMLRSLRKQREAAVARNNDTQVERIDKQIRRVMAQFNKVYFDAMN